MHLSIHCATRGEPHAWPFLSAMADLAQRCAGVFIITADGEEAFDRVIRSGIRVELVNRSEGHLHQIVGDLVAAQRSEYMLCLDDDERCTEKLEHWLVGERYRTQPMWRFPRAWLWQDATHFLAKKPHWPDHQTRLGRTDSVYVPTRIHAGWLRGNHLVSTCPHAIEHHKLLIRTKEDRERAVEEYESIRLGAGKPEYYLPENRETTVGQWSA